MSTINEEEIRKAIHNYIGECLTQNLVNFKADALAQLALLFPEIEANHLEALYDSEYDKWSDAYCD